MNAFPFTVLMATEDIAVANSRALTNHLATKAPRGICLVFNLWEDILTQKTKVTHSNIARHCSKAGFFSFHLICLSDLALIVMLTASLTLT